MLPTGGWRRNCCGLTTLGQPRGSRGLTSVVLGFKLSSMMNTPASLTVWSGTRNTKLMVGLFSKHFMSLLNSPGRAVTGSRPAGRVARAAPASSTATTRLPQVTEVFLASRDSVSRWYTCSARDGVVGMEPLLVEEVGKPRPAAFSTSSRSSVQPWVSCRVFTPLGVVLAMMLVIWPIVSTRDTLRSPPLPSSSTTMSLQDRRARGPQRERLGLGVSFL